jgi:hypothetical protein
MCQSAFSSAACDLCMCFHFMVINNLIIIKITNIDNHEESWLNCEYLLNLRI